MTTPTVAFVRQLQLGSTGPDVLAVKRALVKWVAKLKQHGIVDPVSTVAAAATAKLPLPYACALLEKESGGGQNVFGHDPTIFIGAGEVTEAKYAEYKRQRIASGNRLMQGVGPCQLTYYSYQDQADAKGGCWVPLHNMEVGFALLQSHIARYGEQAGAAAYNGSGPAADAYGRDFVQRAAAWKARLG